MHLDLGEQAIRNYREEDLQQLIRQADDHAVWQNLTDMFPHPYTADKGRDWIKHATSQEPRTNFAIVDNVDHVIGGIGLELERDIYRVSAEIGYWLGREWWGQGIATRAVRAMTDWAFNTFTLERIQAGIFETNPASGRVLEKAGYLLEGRLRRKVIKEGRVRDLLMYARLR
jgi:[ribosomal protein S5]-alanine N-acetyltransferase